MECGTHFPNKQVLKYILTYYDCGIYNIIKAPAISHLKTWHDASLMGFTVSMISVFLTLLPPAVLPPAQATPIDIPRVATHS